MGYDLDITGTILMTDWEGRFFACTSTKKKLIEYMLLTHPLPAGTNGHPMITIKTVKMYDNVKVGYVLTVAGSLKGGPNDVDVFRWWESIHTMLHVTSSTLSIVNRTNDTVITHVCTGQRTFVIPKYDRIDEVDYEYLERQYYKSPYKFISQLVELTKDGQTDDD